MRRTTMIATALFALSLAPALQAQWGYRDQDRYRYDGQRTERIAVLAHELEEVAASIYREAARNNRRPNRAEARVLADLRDLNAQASRFHDRVEGAGYRGYRQGSHPTARDFAALEDAFFETADSLRYIQRRSYIDRGMDRIHGLMSELSRYYGRGSRDRYGYDRWDRGRQGRYEDRYDRGRHDRDWYKDHGDDDDDDDEDEDDGDDGR
jgi:hypothetical protein